jgi:hypothetical protein
MFQSNNYILNATHTLHLEIYYSKTKCILEFFSQTNNFLNPSWGEKKKQTFLTLTIF